VFAVPASQLLSSTSVVTNGPPFFFSLCRLDQLFARRAVESIVGLANDLPLPAKILMHHVAAPSGSKIF